LTPPVAEIDEKPPRPDLTAAPSAHGDRDVVAKHAQEADQSFQRESHSPTAPKRGNLGLIRTEQLRDSGLRVPVKEHRPLDLDR
jgi:hypothetical protein